MWSQSVALSRVTADSSVLCLAKGPERPARDPARVSDPAFGAWTAAEGAAQAESIAGMAVPAYRNQVVSPSELARRGQVLDEMGVGPNGRRALMEFFTAEGGARSHPGSQTHAGITGDTATRYGELLDPPISKPPKDLKPEEQVAILQEIHNDPNDSRSLGPVGGFESLERIGDAEAAALADAFYASPSSETRVEVIQRAVNAVDPGAVDADGQMVPETFDAYTRLARDPATKGKLLDALADARWNDVRASGVITSHEAAGWRTRIDHFRFRK